MKTEEILIYLATCVVNGIIPDIGMIYNTGFEDILRFADFHSLKAIAATGFYRAAGAGLQLPSNQIQLAKNHILAAARRDSLFDAERAKVLTQLEEQRIWYLPLKGILLKTYYPEPYLREMADNDILYDADRAEDVKTIMTSLGYSVEEYEKRNHDTYMKQPCFNFEMHRTLFDSATPLRTIPEYYTDLTPLLKKDPGNGYGYHLSEEDFYLYMIAHEYKHYALFGTGIRSLLDTYVFLNKCSDRLDWKYIREEADKLGISDFEEKNRRLAMKLFSIQKENELDEDEQKMLTFFNESGSYGAEENLVIKYIQGSGMPKYVFRRIFLSMESIRRIYPFFYKYKVLIPFLPFYRIIHLRKRAIAEIRFLRKQKTGRRNTGIQQTDQKAEKDKL